METPPDLELSTFPSRASSTAALSTAAALPPVDTGRAAWSFLAAATVIEVLVWGLPFSVGVLHSYWTTVLFPPGTPGESLIALAATLQTGLMYCTCVFFGPLLLRFPHQRRNLQAFGLLCATVGIVGSAFVTKPFHLVLTIGLIYPISCLYYFPAATLLFEWFQVRRGLASGVLFAGTGAGGTVFPFIMQGLIRRFGYRAAMVSLGIGYGLIGLVALAFIKPRIPVPKYGSADAKIARKIDPVFLKRSTFYAFTGTILISSLGNFIPSVWIPSYAVDLGLPESTGTLLIALMNASSVPGLLLLGWLSDRWPLRIVISLSSFGSALACLFIWGFATNVGALMAFVIIFGALGLSFTALWTRLITIIARDDPALPTVIFSIFAFARGVGNISSGPIASALLAGNQLSGSKGGYGVKNYGSLLAYTGITMVLGSIAGLLYREGPRTHKVL